MSLSFHRMGRPRGLGGLLAGLLVLLAGCGESGEQAAKTESGGGTAGSGRVVVTIFPLWDLARQVAGEAAEVALILPAGRSPHGYELTPRDRMRLREARILVLAGGGVDSWVTKAAEAEIEAGGLKVLNLYLLAGGGAEGEGDAEEHAGHDGHAPSVMGMNPHQWLVPSRAKVLVRRLREALVAEYPANAAGISERAEAVLGELDELDRAYREALVGVEDLRMITFHDAFDPLADAYGIAVVASIFRVEAQQMTPADLQRIERLVNAEGVRAIFVEPQFGSVGLLEARLGGRVTLRTLDPLGGGTELGENESYFEMMRSNLAVLVAGLRENVGDEG